MTRIRFRIHGEWFRATWDESGVLLRQPVEITIYNISSVRGIVRTYPMRADQITKESIIEAIEADWSYWFPKKASDLKSLEELYNLYISNNNILKPSMPTSSIDPDYAKKLDCTWEPEEKTALDENGWRREG